MTKRRLTVPCTLAVALLWAASADVHAEKKVSICHRPPGNPANSHTISVGESATAAHLKHGDQLGECPRGCQLDASLCNDGNACTSDTCLSNGQCAHEAVNCDDGNPCTTDLCVETSGCIYVPASGSCDDGNACTSGDVCANATCHGNPVPGCCQSAGDCDDHNPCTTDACAGGACQNQAVDCRVTDKCLAGFCDPATGTCATAPVNCSDSNVCTDDFCDSATGCFSQPTTHPPEARETSCADGADNDCDGLVDSADPDCCADSDRDGTSDCEDGCPADPAKTSPGACGCGVADRDSDGDGIADCHDACPADPAKTSPGACGCGVADTDSDGDGIADCHDACPADPGTGTPTEKTATLTSTGVDGDASGTVQVGYAVCEGGAVLDQQLTVQVQNLAASASFMLVVDGIQVASFTTDANGAATVHLDPLPAALMPITKIKLIEIMTANGQVVLTAQL